MEREDGEIRNPAPLFLRVSLPIIGSRVVETWHANRPSRSAKDRSQRVCPRAISQTPSRPPLGPVPRLDNDFMSVFYLLGSCLASRARPSPRKTSAPGRYSPTRWSRGGTGKRVAGRGERTAAATATNFRHGDIVPPALLHYRRSSLAPVHAGPNFNLIALLW